MYLGLIIILAGAAISVIQLWAPLSNADTVPLTAAITAVLGAIVILAKGIERIWNFDDNWGTYRQAAEGLKRERRLYVTAAGPYSWIRDEDKAYRLFIERVEEVIAIEQQSYWQRSREEEAKEEE